MVNHQLYSSSYDGTMRLWNTNSEKIEPMTLLSADSWIMNFTFDSSKQYAWIGDQNGNLTEALLSVPMMADIISKKLKSNFTKDEWNYYMGINVPYETIVSETRKEVTP
jgi:WD40 repeat protein